MSDQEILEFVRQLAALEKRIEQLENEVASLKKELEDAQYGKSYH